MGDDINKSILPPFPYDILPLSPITTSNNNPEYISLLADIFGDENSSFDTTLYLNSIDDTNQNAFDAISNLCIDHNALQPWINYQQSTTVNPICTSLTLFKSGISDQAQFEDQLDLQYGSSESEKIKIKTHPRLKFRPRTEKECKDAAHYIRCDDHVKPAYPTIAIPRSWSKQKTVIEITLVGIDKEPHLYCIDNKERHTSELIFKTKERNSLYFHVTPQDYEKGEKSFLIQYMKSKQDDEITKPLIRDRQLDRSMLRFTRYYQADDGVYHRVPASVEYSTEMAEDYGNFSIVDVFPLYGPMGGNQKVCVETKGSLPQDLMTGMTIKITAHDNQWSVQVKDIKKNRNTFTFLMPRYPYNHKNRANANIIIDYQQTIHQSSYMYTRKLDDELLENQMYESATTSCNAFSDQFPIRSSTGMGFEDRGAKRLRQ